MEAIKKVIADAFRTARRKPLTYVGIVAIPLIVALFGLLYVNVFMDPYDRMKALPVAVVNLDEGTLVDEERRNYGDELAEAIQEDDSVLWTREDASLVEEGLEHSDYYMAVVIPADFSERVAAGQTSSPETANVIFFSNMRKNFMLSTLSSKIEMALRATVNEEIGAQYVEALAEGLYDAKEGFSEALDGATQLKDGSRDLSAGGLDLVSGMGELSDGTVSLSDGLGELRKSLSGKGTGTLASAASAVETGAEALGDGLAEAKAGAAALAEGAQSAGSGLAEAEAAARGVEDGLAEAVIAWRSGALPADAAMAALEANLLPAAENHALSSGIGRARTALGDSGDAGSGTVIGAAKALEEGLAQAEGSLGSRNAPDTLLYGIHRVSEGIGLIDSAVESALEGSEALAEGAADALEGAIALSAGAQDLDEGISRLQEGLSEGYASLDESLTATPREYADYIVAPVETEEEIFGELDAFGYGFAPFFLSLCLWLGSLLLFFIFEPFPSRDADRAGRFAVIFGRWPLYLILAMLNVGAAGLGAVLSGVPHADSREFWLFLACIGFSFLCILHLFSLFDIPGKALAIVVLIVQVVCCSGTFPAVLGEGVASQISVLLPFTYAIDGIRACMSAADSAAVFSDMGRLMLFALGAVVLSLILYPLALTLKHNRDAATIKALSGAHASPSALPAS